MTRNQKIALGCGGAGCLGLIVVVIAGCVIYYFAAQRAAAYRAAAREYNFNVNLNSNSNSNGDSNYNSNSNSSSSSSASSMSDDDKHKLFQAAAVTSDTDVIKRVNLAIGIWEEGEVPGDKYRQFVMAHGPWLYRNLDFVQTISTPEKARAYVDEHLE